MKEKPRHIRRKKNTHTHRARINVTAVQLIRVYIVYSLYTWQQQGIHVLKKTSLADLT